MRKTFIAVSIVTMMLLPSLSAFAQEGDVELGSYVLFRMRCPSGGQTVADRAAAVQQRVNDLLTSEGINLSTVKVVSMGKEAAIYVAGNLLVTVDECTARANKTTPIGLAKTWADRFKQIYPIVAPKNPNEPSTHIPR